MRSFTIAVGAFGCAALLCSGVTTGAQLGSGKALTSPECIKVPEARAELPEDEMLGVGRNGEYCAYPLRMMAHHRIVNDHLGGPPILVAYDPESGSGQVYDPVLDKQELLFDHAGIVGGQPMLKDRQTGSRWSQITGEAIDGTMKGKRLSRIPSWIIAWRRWKELHPDSYVLKEDPSQSPHYVARTTPASCPIPADVRRTLPAKLDKRLPEDTLVFGVADSKSAKAYPLANLERGAGVYVDRLTEGPVVILYDPFGRAAGAFSAALDGKTASFTAVDSGGTRLFKDSVTGTLWNIEGAGVEGASKGKSLAAAPFARARWFAWSAAHPGTAIVRPRR